MGDIMNKFLTFIKKEKGLYRITFCLCAIFLCALTVVISNNESSQRIEEVISDSDADKMLIESLDNKKSDHVLNNNQKPASSIVSDDTSVKGDSSIKNENDETAILNDKSFAPPINGEVIKKFSIDELLYSKTMDDWRIHTGIDISADVGSDIFASQAGVVKFVGYDINMGYIVTIENGAFECSYMSLSSEIPVHEGRIVKKGQYIGTISDSGVQELCDGGHLHFEIKKDGQIVDPSEYIYNR